MVKRDSDAKPKTGATTKNCRIITIRATDGAPSVHHSCVTLPTDPRAAGKGFFLPELKMPFDFDFDFDWVLLCFESAVSECLFASHSS